MNDLKSVRWNRKKISKKEAKTLNKINKHTELSQDLKQHKAAKAKEATEKLKHPEEEEKKKVNKEPAKGSNLDDL